MTIRSRRPNRRAAMPAALPIALAAALSLAACASRDEPVVHRQVQKLAPVEVAVAVPVAATVAAPAPAHAPPARASDPAHEVRSSETAAVAARTTAPPFIRDLPTAIYYENDAYLVAPEFRPLLAQHARNLKADPKLRMQVVAYTDAKGPVDYNRALAQMRASTVIKALAEMGVDRSQLEPQARGIDRANARAADPAAEARSRRVELVYRR